MSARRLATFAALSLAMLLYLGRALDVRTAITDFLPQDRHAARLELARALSSSPQSRVMVVTLSAPDAEQHRRAAAAMAEHLRADARIAWVRSGLAERDQEALYQLYFPARLGLLELPPGSGPVPDAWIAERLRALKERLASPLGVIAQRLAPADPLGSFEQVVLRFGKERGQLKLEAGQLVTRDGKSSVLFAATQAPAFDAAAQAGVISLLEQTFARERARASALTLEWTGINRFAVETERSIRGDVERISSGSLIGIFLLYWLVFRSLREPLIVLLPIAFGCLLAVTVCQVAFGFVHGLALAFGSAIVGVAEDYSTHYFAHRRAAAAREPNEALMRRLLPGMALGALTTIAGIAALAFCGLPGLSQMAVFGAAGVFGALLCTRYVVPELSRRGPLPPTRRLGPLGQRLLEVLLDKPAMALLLLVPTLALAASGLPQLEFHDGLSALRTPTPALDAENRRVQARLGRGNGGRVVVSSGVDDEAALRAAERATLALGRAVASGWATSFESATGVIPSLATQRARWQRLASDPTFLPRFHEAARREGFREQAFGPFEAALTQREPALLTPAQLLGSPLRDLLGAARVELPAGGVAYLAPVTTEQPAALAAALEGIEGVTYVDQEGLFREAYGRFRSRTLVLLGTGFLLVMSTLFIRYRSVRLACAGMLPAVFGAAGALGTEAWLGFSANIMHVIATLLVISMGVDYGIYALESRGSLEEGVTTLGSILLAALTTVLSFGLLGVSTNPALAGIGSTVALGLVFTVLASPLAIVLARRGGGA